MQDKYEIVSNPTEDFFVVRSFMDGRLYRAYRRHGTPYDYQDEIFAYRRLGQNIPGMSILADVVSQYDDTFMIYSIPQSTSIVPFDPDMDEDTLRQLLFQILETLSILQGKGVHDFDLSIENLEVDMDNEEILLSNVGRMMVTAGPDMLTRAFHNLLVNVWMMRTIPISEQFRDLMAVSGENNASLLTVMFHPFFRQSESF